MTDGKDPLVRDYFERGEHELRFGDLEELFVARVLLGCTKGNSEAGHLKVELTLAHIFPAFKTMDQVLRHLHGKAVRTRDPLADEVASVLSFLGPQGVSAAEKTEPALSFYDAWMDRRLGYLLSGDDLVIEPQTIRSFERVGPCVFLVEFDPRHLARELAQALPRPFEIQENFIRKTQALAPFTMPRIDHRKILAMITEYLDSRTSHTGETLLTFDTTDLPFGHAIQSFSGTPLMSVPGTARAKQKYQLAMLLEAHADLDIDQMFVKTDPLQPEQAVVHFAVRRPAITNIYGATERGLRAAQRSEMTEVEISVYTHTHEELRKRLVFGGRPHLEESFAALASWLLRKLSYSLEEPSFLRDPAISWIAQHSADKYVKFEDDFLLPFLHERLVDKFGTRVTKKPEKFGGEIDLLFDNTIPVELKVRRGGKTALAAVLDEKYPATGQAAAYAAHSRLGVVVVLDLPNESPTISNLDSSVRVVERDLAQDGSYPTCVVVFIFHAHHPKPSSVGQTRKP